MIIKTHWRAKRGRDILIPILFFFLLFLLSQTASAVKISAIDRIRTHMQRGELDRAEKLLGPYIRNNPEDSQGYFFLARVHLKKEEVERAKELLEKARRYQPENKKYIEELGRLYFITNKNEEALELYILLLKEQVETQEIFLQLAQIYSRLGKSEEALKAAEKGVSLNSADPGGYIILGEIYLNHNRPKMAAKSYERAFKLGYRNKSILYKLGGIYDDTGDYDKAIGTYRKILKIHSNELEPHKILSRLYRRKGDILNSLKSWFSFIMGGGPAAVVLGFLIGFGFFFIVFHKAFRYINSILMLPLVLIAGGLGRIKWLKFLSRMAALYATDHIIYFCSLIITLIDPDDADAWQRMAIYYESKENFDLALKAYRQAIKINPKKGDVWFSIGVLLLRKDSFKDAELAFKDALNKGEDNYLIWYHLALSFLKQEMFTEAAEAAHQALEMSPEFPPSLDVFIESCEHSGQIGKCEKRLLDLLEMKPGNIKMLLETGNLFLASGRAKKSLQYFREAIKLSPESYEAWYNLGVAQREAGLLENALNSIKQAIEIAPDASWIHTSYGLTHIMNRKVNKAEKILNKALELDPLSSYPHFLMGTILKEKEPERAENHLKAALKNFSQEISGLKKPWQKANEYECIALTHQMTGQKKQARDALIQAVKYAKISPHEIWIFSEKKMKLTPPEDFILECQERLNKIEPEVTVEFSADNKIS